MRSKRFSASPLRHSLQINLDKTSEPVVGLSLNHFINFIKPFCLSFDIIFKDIFNVSGLDFIQESDEWSNETLFECKLCVCSNLKHSSAFQHILGFRHRLNYIVIN